MREKGSEKKEGDRNTYEDKIWECILRGSVDRFQA